MSDANLNQNETEHGTAFSTGSSTSQEKNTPTGDVSAPAFSASCPDAEKKDAAPEKQEAEDDKEKAAPPAATSQEESSDGIEITQLKEEKEEAPSGPVGDSPCPRTGCRVPLPELARDWDGGGLLPSRHSDHAGSDHLGLLHRRHRRCGLPVRRLCHLRCQGHRGGCGGRRHGRGRRCDRQTRHDIRGTADQGASGLHELLCNQELPEH